VANKREYLNLLQIPIQELRKCGAVLGIPPVAGPQEAVKAAIVAEMGRKK
jgi:hypothetical protein